MVQLRILLLFCFIPYLVYSQETKDPILNSLSLKLDTVTSEANKIKALLEIGDYQIEKQFSKAEKYLNEAKELIDSSDENYQDELAFIYTKLGVINRRKGNYGDAVTFYFNARKIYERLRDTSNIADIIHNTALLYRFLGDDKRAVIEYKKSLEYSTKVRDSFTMAATYNMLGVSYRRLKFIDSALVCYAKAEKIFKFLNKEEDVRGVYNNMATLYSVQRKYRTSLPIKLDNLSYYKRIGNKTSMATAYYNVASDYLNLKEYDIALRYADSSLVIGLNEGFKDRISKAYLRKSKIYRLTNKYEEALRNYRYFKKYSDSILKMQSVQKTQQLELQYRYENEKKEIEIAAIQKETKFNFYIIILIIVIITIIIIAYLLWRNYTARVRIVADKFEKEKLKKEILKQQIKISESEIKTLIVDNDMRLKFSKDFLSQLKEDKKHNKDLGIKKYIQSLIFKLKQQIGTEEKLSNIQNKLNEVNKGFEEDLTEKFPSLSKSEREVCHLLRLNISIKEMAAIRNSSIDSIKSIRYRLRKKLNIPKGVDLEVFIKGIQEQ